MTYIFLPYAQIFFYFVSYAILIYRGDIKLIKKFLKTYEYSPVNNICSALIITILFYAGFHFLFPDDNKFFNFLLNLYELLPLSIMLSIFNDHFSKTKSK